MLKIIYNKEQNVTLEDFINAENDYLVKENNSNLDERAIKIKEAWQIVIDRMKLFGVIAEK